MFFPCSARKTLSVYVLPCSPSTPAHRFQGPWLSFSFSFPLEPLVSPPYSSLSVEDLASCVTEEICVQVIRQELLPCCQPAGSSPCVLTFPPAGDCAHSSASSPVVPWSPSPLTRSRTSIQKLSHPLWSIVNTRFPVAHSHQQTLGYSISYLKKQKFSPKQMKRQGVFR